jgi:hypothetical protein
MAADAPVAFLFLGETLLIPHLYPVVEALATRCPGLPVDVWVSTDTHQALIEQWLPAGGSVRLRPAPGFRRACDDPGQGRNPLLPNKLLTLARLAPGLMRTRVVLCAEQTSLWLPALLPLRTRFLHTSHGVGSMSARDDRRRRAAWKLLVPSELERRTYLDRGFTPDKVVATGYVKASFRYRSQSRPRFDAPRPTILYTPHWRRHRSSWWDWGRSIVELLAGQHDYNVIFAPHQRLREQVPELPTLVAELNRLPHVHADLDSFAMVDGSYTAAADIYLGDTSSQVVEFLARPRPVVFLNSQRIDWRATSDHGFWECGEVLDRLDGLMAALARAPSLHEQYLPVQTAFASASLGELDGGAPARIVAQILAALS